MENERNTETSAQKYSIDELATFYRNLVVSEYGTAGNPIFMGLYGYRVKELGLKASDICNKALELFPNDKAKFRNQELNQAFKMLDYFIENHEKINIPYIHVDSAMNHVLEEPIADYLTQHDHENIDNDELVALYKDVYQKADKDYALVTQLFALQYTMQIKDIPTSGNLSIAYQALGNAMGSMGDEIKRGIKLGLELRTKISNPSQKHKIIASYDLSKYSQYLSAIRTKPFLLLAGISGTGKSRIVRELAFKSCPRYLQDRDGTTPGNYCMIEVKPNWHDSTELLGYYSNLKEKYLFTKFAKFLVKAKMYPEVPFFVCLDEMNLAPVEQYFAEILSVLETRKSVIEGGKKTIKTGAIIGAEHFKRLGMVGAYNPHLTDRDIYMKLHDIDTEDEIDEAIGARNDLTIEGLTLPDNVVIIGTVNMDDTTHQFSRKVIDRAMTIEMNGGKLKDMFGGSKRLSYLEEAEQQKWQHAFKQHYVSADEVLEAHNDKADEIIELLPAKLEAINSALKGTPFEVSYRVLNELTIMVGVMLDNSPEEDLETIVNQALDRILLMKILPRIEGDSDMFNLKTPKSVNGVTCHNRLEWLRELAPNIVAKEEGETTEHQQTAREKIVEMIERLENQEFTRFWP